MAHFAKINANNIVITVIVAEQDFIDTKDDSSSWIQTSYNTRGGKHYAPDSQDEDDGVALRKNFAGKGFFYDEAKDAFIPPQPFSSWLLNEDTCIWESPVPYPDDDRHYYWDNSTVSWVHQPYV